MTKVAITVAAATLVLLASAPAFAHGGMGHMGGNMRAHNGGFNNGGRNN